MFYLFNEVGSDFDSDMFAFWPQMLYRVNKIL